MLNIVDIDIQPWLSNGDAFAQVKAIEGKVVRSKEGRVTKRVDILGRGYYVKYHAGVGWGEILKNLIRLRLPIIGASNEWLAVERLQALGLDTLSIAAYGRRGLNPASQQSFLITEELTNVISLEDLFADEPLAKTIPAAFKWALIKRVASMTRRMHEAGINHRDLYICHFLLKQEPGSKPWDIHKLRMHLIDLHRTQMRKTVPFRWLAKDLGSLYFSILQAGFTRRDIIRFMVVYFDRPIRVILQQEAKLLLSIRKRAINLYQRDFGAVPALPW